jgi:DNA-binding NarL/FixJ family response regulator
VSKIVIADDDPRMRQMLKQIVGSIVTTIFEAADGAEAIAVCAAERPDWVLMDLRMKPVDGLRATAEVSARFPETRVVIVTQHDDAELQAEAFQAGAFAYVLKENLLELPGILLGEQMLFHKGQIERKAKSNLPELNDPNSDSPKGH